VITSRTHIEIFLYLGVNTKASLLSRGLIGISRFVKVLDMEQEIFLGFVSSRDLIVTATSNLSRNFRVCLELQKVII
jgi:glycerol-3-phosphate dehydrogenase (NAD(P)+)